ncbi:MAG TPA: glycosyltransferase family 1 protein [Ferruginibacter sp.]|nr:glycosyltransferase family 1 protein [Ferruginibacter sp.]
MNIAVNTRLQKTQQPQGYENFVFNLLEKLTEKFPQHRFIYLFDNPYTGSRVFAKNVSPVVVGPITSNSLKLQYWLNFKIPKILRRHKVDIFLSLDGICSLRTKIPQSLVVSHLAWMQQSYLQKKWVSAFYKKNIPLFLTKAKSIAAISKYVKTQIEDNYKLPVDEIDLIYPGVDENFLPLDWEKSETIREKYTDGKAYFFYSGNIDEQANYINLLKAFTFFKKRQKSNMLLLIAGKPNEQFIKDFKTYRLKNEVKLQQNLTKEETAQLTAAAYAVIYPVLHTDYFSSLLQAMHCQVPIITSDAKAMHSICGQAAIYCNPASFEDIAQKMMLVYKDENKAKALVEAAKNLSKQYNWDIAAQTLMQWLEKTINA